MLTLDKEKQIQEVIKLRDEDKLTFDEIGQKLGFSEKTARRRYTVGLLEEDDTIELPEDEDFKVTVKSNYVPDDKPALKRFAPLVRTGDVLISADYHVPLHDPKVLNTLIECGRKNKIKNLIIAGDFFNMDSFSSYLPHQPEAAWETERKDGNIIMKTLLRTFDEVDIVWGNHDFRLTKATGFKHSFTECMKWAFQGLSKKELARIRFSDLDYMTYKVGDWTFRVCHPTNFSSIPLTVPRQLALKYSCGIISAHSHHLSMGVAPNGKDLILEAGGFFDKTRTEYIQKTTAHHEWVPGFIMFKDAKPNLISPVFGTDEPYRKEKK